MWNHAKDAANRPSTGFMAKGRRREGAEQRTRKSSVDTHRANLCIPLHVSTSPFSKVTTWSEVRVKAVFNNGAVDMASHESAADGTRKDTNQTTTDGNARQCT